MEGQSNGSLREVCLELEKMLKPPEMYESNKICIYRVPHSLREVNPKIYTPQIVSIGPVHKARNVGKEDNILESMEEFKLKYLQGFLNRTKRVIMDLLLELREMEKEIRSYYVEPIKYNSDDFLKMVLIDACFIVEHFMRWNHPKGWERKDPLLQKQRMLMDIKKDLILLENQLPFFVLEHLYKLANNYMNIPAFLRIAFNYFEELRYGTNCPKNCPKHFTDLLRTCMIFGGRNEIRHPTNVTECPRECRKHFTDLLRTCMILPSKFLFKGHGGRNDGTDPEEGIEIRHLYNASQLLEAGLKFKRGGGSIVDLKYDRGVLKMPFLTIDDNTELVFRNIMAFEDCHFPDEDVINQYHTILDFLINTEKDVNVLVDKKIIENLMGDANQVATMVNHLGLNAVMPSFNEEYISLCKSLNDFYENPRNKYWAIFIHEYFNTPWKIASTVAAVVLLLLTLIQTICSIISLF